jgi:hypothetical protein
VNHLTLSLENCSVTANTIQFDIYATSDGDQTSDLRAHGFQIGLNFNTAILPTRATITTSYVNNSSDFPDLGEFNFPSSPHLDHIRIVQSPYSRGNTGKTMISGQSYRVGTFLITCSSRWVQTQSPDLEFQTTTVRGKTICAVTTWIGNNSFVSASSSETDTSVEKQVYTAINRPVPAALSATMNCSIARRQAASNNSADNAQSLSVYPNPAQGIVTVVFRCVSATNYHLSMIDIGGKEIITKDGRAASGNNSFVLSLEAVAKGTYLINMKTNNFNNSVRTVVE